MSIITSCLKFPRFNKYKIISIKDFKLKFIIDLKKMF